MVEGNSGTITQVRRPIVEGTVYFFQVIGGTVAIFAFLGLLIWGLHRTDPNRDRRPFSEQMAASRASDLMWLKRSCPPLAPDIDRALALPTVTEDMAQGLRMRAKVIMQSPVKGQICEILTPSEIRRMAR